MIWRALRPPNLFFLPGHYHLQIILMDFVSGSSKQLSGKLRYNRNP